MDALRGAPLSYVSADPLISNLIWGEAVVAPDKNGPTRILGKLVLEIVRRVQIILREQEHGAVVAHEVNVDGLRFELTDRRRQLHSCAGFERERKKLTDTGLIREPAVAEYQRLGEFEAEKTLLPIRVRSPEDLGKVPIRV